METVKNYELKADDFLTTTKTSFKISYLKYDTYFYEDREKRFVFNFELSRNNRKYSGTFGGCLNSVKEATEHLPCYCRNKEYRYTCKNDMLQISCLNCHRSFRCSEKTILPSAYDVLACLTKYEVGSFENFCSEFGCDTDSRKAEKIYNAVAKEYMGLCSLYNDEEMVLLQEIS